MVANGKREFEKIRKKEAPSQILLLKKGYEHLRPALLDEEAHINWRNVPGMKRFAGKSDVISIPLKDEKFRLLLKHYHHGGIFRFFSHDRFLANNLRGLEDFEKHQALSKMGINVPEVIGAHVFKKGDTYRARLYMKEMGNSETLKEFLTPGRHTLKERKEAMIKVGEEIRKMHDNGVQHNHLTPNNILIATRALGFKPYIIDVEYMKMKKELTANETAKELKQFERKMRKHIDMSPMIMGMLMEKFFSAYRRAEKTK